MAEYLASIFGTEKDKNTAKSADGSHSNMTGVMQSMSDEEMQEHYDNFFEDVFVECEDKYGEIEEMNVCDNLGDHLVGNVYIKFRREEDAEKAVKDLNNRWFGGRPVYAELSPVTDFREACCRQYEMGLRAKMEAMGLEFGGRAGTRKAFVAQPGEPSECTRSGFCNFMHLKPISRELRRELYGRRRRSRSRDRSERSDRSSGRRRSRSKERRRSRSRDRRDGRSGRY